MSKLTDRLSHAWNAFVGVDPPSNRPPRIDYTMLGPSSSYRPDRVYFRRTTEKSLVSSYLNRIANDCASIAIKHVKLDSSKRYTEDVKSGFIPNSLATGVALLFISSIVNILGLYHIYFRFTIYYTLTIDRQRKV